MNNCVILSLSNGKGNSIFFTSSILGLFYVILGVAFCFDWLTLAPEKIPHMILVSVLIGMGNILLCLSKILWEKK